MLNDILNEQGLIRVWSKIKSLISGSIGNATLTIKQNNNTVGTFTSNATTNVDVNITVPTHTSDLINDGEGGSPVDTFVKQSEIVQSDWNQNDETADEYIKNRICFEEGKEIVNVDTEGETVIEIPEFDSDIDSTHTYKAICNENGEINMYDCEYIVATDSEKIIKNGKFALYVWKEGHEKTGATLYIEEEISSISIQEDYSLHKLDEKYIPDTIARKTYVDGVDQNLQQQIDAITSSTDVRDVVGTYAELLAYDTSVLFNDDIVKVLVDENKNNAISYYRWVITEGVGAWSYIGSQGPFYTKAESDSKYVPKTTTINGKDLSADITLTKSDVGLGNVDNTSDLNKPISTATQTALNAKANDSNVLHKTGAETASGVKTFSDGIKIANVGVQYDATNECLKFVFN